MKLQHLEDIAAHIASGNCSHPPLPKDFVFDQYPVEGSTPLILACQHDMSAKITSDEDNCLTPLYGAVSHYRPCFSKEQQE